MALVAGALALAVVGCEEPEVEPDAGMTMDGAPQPEPDGGSGEDAGSATRDGGSPDARTAADGASSFSDAGAAAGLPLGSPCTDGTDCASEICFPTGFGSSICSQTCSSTDACVAGWECGDFGGRDVCRCDIIGEACNGVDDDCDGTIDEGDAVALGCGEGESCVDGACSCPAERMCGMACIDTDTNPSHCGGCGEACALADVCTSGSCCTPSTETCNGTDDDCDGTIDEGRGEAIGCAAEEACVDGACGCGGAMCGARCVDLNSDSDHCGTCGHVCASGLDCVDGVCCEAAGNRVDMLFMIDNSNSMVEEQASLAAQLPRMVEVLATGDLDGDGTPESEPVRDLHLGVVTSDMGTGGHEIPTCRNADFGDDGILRTEGNVSVEGCRSSYPPFLEFRPADPGADAEAAGSDFACVALAGTGGCGFEQQFEAVLKAVTPSTSPVRFFRSTVGHGDGVNDGFLRDDSLLVTLLLTDENDCSAADPDIFNPSSPTYTANFNLRCYLYQSALTPLNRYVQGLLALREDPRDLLFAAITGVPVDLIPSGSSPDYDRILADSRMTEQEVPGENQLVPSCEVPGRGRAFPPRRIVRLAQLLHEQGATGVLGSICQEDYTYPMSVILDRIVRRLRESCAPSP